MSIIRQDPTTKEWVIIATERAKRAHDFKRAREPGFSAPREGSCPFCPGNEARTPPGVLRIPDANGMGWAVRVIPNKFAVLTGPCCQKSRRPSSVSSCVKPARTEPSGS